ncbi:hypothetical protein [Roseiflexus sp.]|uniref:hypothetical protein n=1 Tax=Roseiflexus sp. TaxID=2562120 RepID=UPI00398ADF06
MIGALLNRLAFIAANVVVMIILHGNSRQWWPKIPCLSLRNESVGEHTRLLFNTLAVVTVAQASIGRLPRERWLPRALTLGVIPALLPGLIWLGQSGLRLKGAIAERYNLALVPILPIAAVVVEDRLAAALSDTDESVSASDDR